MSGDLDMNNNKLKNSLLESCSVASQPTNDNEVVNKS